MKPIRLIELFSGIGSQSCALGRLGIPYQRRICEFDKYAIASYNAIHGTNFETKDIKDIHGKDLKITDTDKFTYLLTYSFPCQDLSCAGKQKGMRRNSHTRSGLLWEVERILLECNELGELPQILLMENVPQVHGKRNLPDFEDWILSLEYLGYKNTYKDLNAKDYGIPQSRNRCFMVSILNGERDFKFPKPIELQYVMKDFLEDKVDEKYYINSDKARELIQKLIGNNSLDFTQQITTTDFSLKNCGRTDIANCICARYDKGVTNRAHEGSCVVEVKKIGNIYGYTGGNFAGNVYDKNCIAPTLSTMQGGNKQPMTIEVLKAEKGINPKWIFEVDVEKCYIRIRKLTPKECFRLMGFTDEEFEKAERVNSNSQLYKQAGNSIVVNVLEHIFSELFKEELEKLW